MGNIGNSEEDIKHRRKKESNTSKAIKKSKHKHKYIKALIRSQNKGIVSVYLGKYCEICGKVLISNYLVPSKLYKGPGVRILTKLDEIVLEYPDYPIYDIQK